MSKASIALNRFGLGARAGDAAPADPQRWLVAQLGSFEARPAAIAAQPSSGDVVRRMAEAYNERRELRQEQRAQVQDMAGEMQAEPAGRLKEAVNPLRQFRQDYVAAVGARTTAALVTDTPFVERLVHFWANHFAISIDKVRVAGLAGPFEFEAIRPHVVGRFSDMLLAVERHPAMLLYLDQAQSIGPDSALGQRIAARGARKAGLNENLAREILELHTLGVRSGYSQADVTEFARAMTGWTVGGFGRRIGLAGTPGEFVFAPGLHQPGSFTVLGKSYAGGGEAQARAVLDDLAAHPATAKHLATKLARHFAGDDPSPALVTRLEAAWTRSGGDLTTVYRALLDAPEAWTEAPAKFRTPWEWGIASLRAAGVKALPGQGAVGLFNQLGQPVWKPGSPAGYDDTTSNWAAPDALLRRVEAAERIAGRSLQPDPRALSAQLFPGSLSPATQTALARAESPAQGLALLLAAPEMMRR